MPSYKLTYFNGRGRGELIRLLFHASGTKFVDERITSADWPALKLKIPHGSLPALEIDGQIHGQSIAIARFVAKQTGLAGKNSTEEFRADVLVDDVSDFAQSLIKVRWEKDETKKAELQKEFQSTTVPKFLAKMNEILKANGDFFVGKSLTWADLSIFSVVDMLVQINGGVLDKTPEMKAFKKRIEGIPKISAYLKARPVTEW